MNFSRIICGTVLVVVGSLALVSAGYGGHGYGQQSNDGALTHYGGGRCHGHGCYNRNQAAGAAAPASHGAYGPYHSYAVRPAIYGGHGLYTYKGYARHQPAPAAHYRHPRSYNMAAAPARHHGGCRGYNCGNNNNYNNNQHHHNLASYSLRPVKALALVHSNYNQNNHNSNYNNNQHQRGHYRAARGAYGHGQQQSYGQGQQQSYGHGQQQQSYGAGHATRSSHYNADSHRANSGRHSYGTGNSNVHGGY